MALYEVFPSLVPEFKEVISAGTSIVTVDLVAEFAGVIAPAVKPAAMIAEDAVATKTRLNNLTLI
jgi:hypothetical protein